MSFFFFFASHCLARCCRYSSRVHLRGNSDTLTTGAPDHLYSSIMMNGQGKLFFFFFFSYSPFSVGGPSPIEEPRRRWIHYNNIKRARARGAGARAHSRWILVLFSSILLWSRGSQIKRRRSWLFSLPKWSPVYKYMDDIQCFPFCSLDSIHTIRFDEFSKSLCLSLCVPPSFAFTRSWLGL